VKIRCWGSRGSIPVSGEEFLIHGGDTTCIEIRTASDEVVIIDCGTGLRRLGNLLGKENRTDMSIILTHAHWDHIIAFPFFSPIYHSTTRIEFYGCPFAQGTIRNILANAMQPPFFPVRLEEAKGKFIFKDSCAGKFNIGSLSVQPILLSHPDQGLGYRIKEHGKIFVFLTDNELGYRHPGGLAFDDYLKFCRGADILFHDAEYTEEEYRRTLRWGHSHYRQALELALAAEVGLLGLFHHNRERNDAELAMIVADCRRIVAERNSGLEVIAVTQETILNL
jgi:phosphoribosyl 1,2-cyclic phosphodiesterase